MIIYISLFKDLNFLTWQIVIYKLYFTTADLQNTKLKLTPFDSHIISLSK